MRRAFTMVEMLAVSALAALFFAAALTITSSIGRSNAAIARRLESDRWPASLVEIIRWDLAQAQSLQINTDGARIQTHASLDPRSLQPLHRPAEVSYSLTTISNRRWLVRRQTLLTDDGTGDSWTTLISPDIASFVLKSATSATRPALGSLFHAVPRMLDLNIRSTNPRVKDLHQSLILR